MNDLSKIDLADRQTAYIQSVLRRTGWNVQTLCNKTLPPINPSTLSVFLNRKRPEHTLNDSTIRRIEAATGIGFDGRDIPSPLPKASAADDAEPYETPHAPDLTEAVDLFLRHGNRTALTLRSDNLKLAGYAANDVLIVDMDVKPGEGDLVLALSGPEEVERKRVVTRLWHEPYLVSAGDDPRSRWPIVVDNWSTRIRGTVVHCLRSRNRA